MRPPSSPSTPAEALRHDLARYGARALVRQWPVLAVVVYRFGQWSDTLSGPWRAVTQRLYWPAYRAVTTLTGIEIPKEARIGGGLRIFHAGPIVVHPDAVIGRNCTMRHGVTIGHAATDSGVPRIGDDVELGAYCQVLGDITVGDRARIGALALVETDVPSGGKAFAPRATIVP